MRYSVYTALAGRTVFTVLLNPPLQALGERESLHGSPQQATLIPIDKL
jgi:hypothetical protein